MQWWLWGGKEGEALQLCLPRMIQMKPRLALCCTFVQVIVPLITVKTPSLSSFPQRWLLLADQDYKSPWLLRPADRGACGSTHCMLARKAIIWSSTILSLRATHIARVVLSQIVKQICVLTQAICLKRKQSVPSVFNTEFFLRQLYSIL